MSGMGSAGGDMSSMLPLMMMGGGDMKDMLPLLMMGGAGGDLMSNPAMLMMLMGDDKKTDGSDAVTDDKDSSSSMKDLLPLLMMSGGAGGDMSSMLPMLMMGGGKIDMKTLLMMQMMQPQEGATAVDMSSMLPLMMMGGGDMKDMLPLLMMGGAGGDLMSNPAMLMMLMGDDKKTDGSD